MVNAETEIRIQAECILTDPAASFALKDMIRASMRRDPVDALADAEAHSDWCRRRLKAIQAL